MFATSFTFKCPWGCTVRVVDGTTQPHGCDGTSRIIDLLRIGAIDPGQTYGEIAERLARGLDTRVRELKGDAFTQGVIEGRAGVVYVDGYEAELATLAAAV